MKKPERPAWIDRMRVRRIRRGMRVLQDWERDRFISEMAERYPPVAAVMRGVRR